MKTYGLIGKDIDYSFSKKYFTEKFKAENISAIYQNFDLNELQQVKEIFQEKKVSGLNVTIPYKETILPFIDTVENEAKKIGAVNTIRFEAGKTIGYNTDSFGFIKSLFPLLEKHHKKALILGTGGASKAVAYSLNSLGVNYKFVSRKKSTLHLTYEQLNEEILNTYLLIVNCTPLGTYPKTEESPEIPYQFLTPKHLLYDLVYNPPITQFLANGKLKGCKISNGKKMLECQAEKAWDIWNM